MNETKPREMVEVAEVADRLGYRHEDVKEAIRTGMLATASGKVYLDDILAVMHARRNVEDFPTLVAHFCAMKVAVNRLETFVKFLADTLHIHQLAVDFSDSDLAGLVDLAKTGLARITTGDVAALVDVLAALTDRDVRRMDLVTGEKHAWRHIILFGEAIEDRMATRTDLMADPRFQTLRRELHMALSHFKAHAKLAIAIYDPEMDPHFLLDELCKRVAKTRVLNRRTPLSIRRSLDRLLERNRSTSEDPQT